MSNMLTVRDEIVAIIEGALGSSDVIVAGAILPRRDMAVLGSDIYIDVLPVSLNQSAVTRSGTKLLATCNIVILKKLTDEEAEAEELFTLTELVANTFAGNTAITNGYVRTSDIKYAPTFDKVEMDQNKLWASNVQVTATLTITK